MAEVEGLKIRIWVARMDVNGLPKGHIMQTLKQITADPAIWIELTDMPLTDLPALYKKLGLE